MHLRVSASEQPTALAGGRPFFAHTTFIKLGSVSDTFQFLTEKFAKDGTILSEQSAQCRNGEIRRIWAGVSARSMDTP